MVRLGTKTSLTSILRLKRSTSRIPTTPENRAFRKIAHSDAQYGREPDRVASNDFPRAWIIDGEDPT